MEPCAPGTEDEEPIMYSTLNKQENEQERLLNQKAILRNGCYENIFELSYVNGAEHWFCKVCECPVMGRVFQHENGRRHKQNLSNTNRHLNFSRKEEPKFQEEEEDNQILNVAPGEPVPPGFEGEIGRVAQIQERLDGFKAGPLVALEYLVELQDYDTTKEPFYLCILCDKRGDPRTVLTHLASYNHITQYLQKHFPTCYRALAPYMTKQYKRNWQVTLQKIAEGIEKKFGRLSPFPIEKDKFEKDRLHYLTLIGKGQHFSELSGYTFEELIVHEELTKSHDDEKVHEIPTTTNWGGASSIQKPFKKRSPSPPVVALPKKTKVDKPKFEPQQDKNRKSPLRRRSLSSVSSISSNDDLEDSPKRDRDRGSRYGKSPPGKWRSAPYARRRSPSPKRRYSPVGRRRSPIDRRHSPSRRPSPGRRPSPVRRPSPGRRPSPIYKKERSPDRRPRSIQDERRNQEEEKFKKMEEFRKLSKAIENDMMKTLKQHEKNPEKHPQYNDEWKKFWNKRYKELQAQGVDAAKYDFKPEWIEFWNKRMVELHSDEVRSKKEALRKRLGLEEIAPIKFKIGDSSSSQISKPNLPMAAQPDQDDEVIVIEDNEDSRSVNRSRSPWEKAPSPVKTSRMPARFIRERSRSRDKKSRSIDRIVKKRSRSRDLSPHSVKSRDYSPRMRNVSRSRDMSVESFKKRDLDSREMRSRSREKSWEKKRIEYRESSFERDIRAKERIRTVADLPWELGKVYRNPYEDYYKPPPVMRDVTREPVDVNNPKSLPEDDNDGEVNVVDVLRILTALEERLGSLGPKVIDLLAKALALEKKDANSSETLLDSDINCVLFETIKEKLKGQLLTGLVDVVEERAFKKAIKKIAGLIHLASQRKSKKEKTTPKANVVTVPGVGSVDRVAIAKQIANALILQGKTDVTQAELEQLINAVVGMAEASKSTNKPMTTASFLQQISQSKTLSQPEMPAFTEKIIIPTSVKKAEQASLQKLTEPLTPSPEKNSTNNMENLSDSDLQTLLQNFKDLSNDEQHNLINYLRKLEYQEPERVEKLRKYVNLDNMSKMKDDTDKNVHKINRLSPFADRIGSVNPSSHLVDIESDEEIIDEQDNNSKVTKEIEQFPVTKIHLDSDEEDYTFDDVVKTATKTVKDKELENNMKIVEESMKFGNSKAKLDHPDMSSAKDLISSLMSNINKNSPKTGMDLLGLGVSSSTSITTTAESLTSNAEFAKTFNSINLDHLVNIVSTVKSLSAGDNKLKFEPPSASNSEPERFNRPDHFQEQLKSQPERFSNAPPPGRPFTATVRDPSTGYQPNRFGTPQNRNPPPPVGNNLMPQQNNMKGPRLMPGDQWSNNNRFGGYNNDYKNRPGNSYGRW